jgi:putative chitinase
MLPTLVQLEKIAGAPFSRDQAQNAKSVLHSLSEFGPMMGLEKPHRLVHFLPQIMHESGRFKYDREIWGPTPAQARYEGRKDLGNTEPGDGKKFAGRGPIQLTGRFNVTRFEEWCRSQGFEAPDFTADPNLINTDPWEGLSAIWYWAIGNPTGKSLNVYADENNPEQITKKINGGLNGYVDRLELLDRTALVLLGFDVDVEAIKQFQREAQAKGLLPAGEDQIDGDFGPKSRAAAFMWLSQATPAVETKAAPVTEEKPVPVVPKGSEKQRGNTWLMGLITLITTNAGSFFTQDLPTKLIILAVSVAAIGFLIWRGEIIARRVKAIIAELG